MTTGAGHGRANRGPRRAAALTLGAALLTSAALTGCSGDDSTAGGPSGSASASSASPSPSASASDAPGTTPARAAARKPTRKPTRPPGRPGRAGQRAFVRYVVAAWAYALRTDDARPLVSTSPAGVPCRGCAAFRASMAQRRREGWSVDLGRLAVRRVALTAQGPGQTYARATVDIPRSSSSFRDGTFRNTSAAHRGATFEVLMRRSGRVYHLLAFTVS
jgi:hypothetical protein